MFRKRNKSDVETEYTCSVRFLDDESMQFSFKKDTIGQWLLDRVAERLNLMEKDYFGLRYMDAEKQRHWIDPLKTVYKQMKGVSPMVLAFRVKFYPDEPMKLQEEITRYYLFLQLRRDLHHRRLLCSPDDAVYLAAYIVQSEVGDYDPEDHPPGYISEFKMLPKQTPQLEDRVMEQHKALHGLVPAEAESNFLKRACTLDTYGVDPHLVKDQRGDQLYLGITHQGIMTFRGSRRTQLYKWAQIRRTAYEGKMFVIFININEEEEDEEASKKQQPVGYKCQSPSASKYLWRCAVEQQLFFTLENSSSAPKLRSGGTLFSRGSKYRFSGRCQTEAQEASQRIHRQEPKFPRSSSLPNFAKHRLSGSNRSSVVLGQGDHLSEDRRPYKEAAVDVPSAFQALHPKPYLSESSYSIKAPLAPQELYDEEQEQAAGPAEATSATDLLIAATTAATTAAVLSPSLNGQVVVEGAAQPEPASAVGGDADASTDMGSFNPEMTLYEEQEEVEATSTTEPVEEEMIQRSDFRLAAAEQINHVGAEAPAGTSSPSPEPTPMKKSGGCAGVCRAVAVSVMAALLLFAVFLYVVYFSGLQHPALTEVRNHLRFLEPVRDLVAQQSRDITAYFER